MTFPADNLRQSLREDLDRMPLRMAVGKWVLERTPFIFSNDEDAYLKWRHNFGGLLTIDPCNIVVTGSAASGISLNPYKYFKVFGDNSDVDVAVVSEYYFLISWRFLRRLGAKLLGYTPSERAAVRDHRERLIYWGTVATDRLLPRLPFGKDWLRHITAVAPLAPVDGRELNVRLYRDFEALRAYQEEGLKKLRVKLLENERFL